MYRMIQWTYALTGRVSLLPPIIWCVWAPASVVYGGWGPGELPGYATVIILTIYVATGVQLEVSLMVVLSIFLGHELVTRALRKRCRKQLNRTNFIPFIPAKTVLDSFDSDLDRLEKASPYPALVSDRGHHPRRVERIPANQER